MEATFLATSVNSLDAVFWITSAWKKVQPEAGYRNVSGKLDLSQPKSMTF
jgi:hypothetical protein